MELSEPVSGDVEWELDSRVGATLADMEREIILKTLSRESGNRTNAARVLGISVRTLRNKLALYGKMDAFK